MAALRQQRRQLQPIIGATSPTYTLVTADVGSTIVVAVTGSNSAGTAGPVSSTATAVVKSSLAPTTPVLDAFNRANGGAGSNWSLIRPTGFATMNVSNNAAVNSSTSLFAWNYWNAANFGPDSEAYMTVASYGASDVIRIGARVTGAGTNSYSGYYVAVSATGAWTIIRIDNGGLGHPSLRRYPTDLRERQDRHQNRRLDRHRAALHHSSRLDPGAQLQHQLRRHPLHHSRSPGPRVQDQHRRRLRRRNAAVTNARARLGECDEARRTASDRASSAENRDRHRAV